MQEILNDSIFCDFIKKREASKFYKNFQETEHLESYKSHFYYFFQYILSYPVLKSVS